MVSVWSELQTCIRPSWCHCHSLSLASVKSRLVLPFWYRLTWVVPDKGLLNVCVCVCACMRACVRACVWVAYFSTFTRLLNTTQYVTLCSVSGKSLYLCARVVCYDTTEYYVYFVFFVAFRVDHCLVFWVKVMPSSLWKNLSLLLNGSVLWRV